MKEQKFVISVEIDNLNGLKFKLADQILRLLEYKAKRSSLVRN